MTAYHVQTTGTHAGSVDVMLTKAVRVCRPDFSLASCRPCFDMHPSTC